MTEIEKIAAGLTDEAKKALFQFDTSEIHGFLVPESGDEQAVDELMKAGCISYILAGGHALIDRTDLGLRVRDHLKGADNVR